jgi:hypothetical protein
LFDQAGYILLTNIYHNALQKVYYICPYGHKGSVSIGNWLYNKTRCSVCANEKRFSAQRLPIDKIYESFKENNYTLITKSI